MPLLSKQHVFTEQFILLKKQKLVIFSPINTKRVDFIYSYAYWHL